MGRKRAGRRKQICLCVAVLIFLTPLACTFTKIIRTRIEGATGETAGTHLVLARKYLARGDYESALKENEKAIALAGKNAPGDESLFYIGLIYAHPANPARNYGKSLASFMRLIRDYPGSPLIEQAKTMAGLQLENDKLNRTVNRLSNTIDEQAKTGVILQQKIDDQVKTMVGLQLENDKLNRTVNRLSNTIDEMQKKTTELNTVIDELKKVDIGVDQKKRENIK